MIFLTRLKILLRQKGTWFWTFAFPFLLVSFEYMAFGTISYDSLDTIDIAIVTEGDNAVGSSVLETFTSLEYSDGKKMYDIQELKSLSDAESKYANDEINLYLYMGDKIIIVTDESSTSATITENVIDEIGFVSETIELAYQKYQEDLMNGKNPEEVDVSAIVNELMTESSVLKDISADTKSNPSTIYFFALLAMTCMFACFWGTGIITDIRANQSNLGIRISASPINKFKLIINYFLAALLIQSLGTVLIFVYMAYILNINLGSNILLILLTMFLGSIAGISLGMFIACVVKGSSKGKEGFSTLISLTLSFLSGTMSVEVKHMIDVNLPFVKYINPASLVTDSLYSLILYSDYSVYILSSILLVVISFLLVFISILRIRGEKYASI